MKLISIIILFSTFIFAQVDSTRIKEIDSLINVVKNEFEQTEKLKKQYTEQLEVLNKKQERLEGNFQALMIMRNKEEERLGKPRKDNIK